MRKIFKNEIDRRVERNLALLCISDGSFRSIFDIVFMQEAQRGYCMSVTDGILGTTRMTYGECGDAIKAIAGNIYEKFGAGGCLGIHADTSVEWIELFWAVLLSGNTPFLINLRQPRSFTEELLQTAGAKAVLAAGRKTEYDLPVTHIDDLSGADVLPDDVVAGNEIILTTSGTTLKKKLCYYTGECFTNQIMASAEIYSQNRWLGRKYKGEINMLAFLPFYHIFGLAAQYMWFCFFGVTFVFPESLEPESLLRSIRRHNVTHIFSVPLLWHTIENSVNREIAKLDEDTLKKYKKAQEISLTLQILWPRLGMTFAKYAFADIRKKLFGDSISFCISGGSYIRESALFLINVLGYPLFNGYGMTETGITSVELSKNIIERIQGSIGKPFSTVEYRRDDEGRLEVKGSILCRHIVEDGVELSLGEWFPTGDLARVDFAGNWYISGREGDIVKSADGEKLSPDEAEACISISSAVNYSILGDEKKEKLILVVQSQPRPLMVKRRRLVDEVRAELKKIPVNYAVSRVYYTDSPLMKEGAVKVSRAYLRREIDSGNIALLSEEEFIGADTAKHAGSVSDENEVAALVRSAMAELLGIDPDTIRPDDNFITDLGGSSLDYFSLLSELEAKTGVRLSVEEAGGEDGNSLYGYSVAEISDALIRKVMK